MADVAASASRPTPRGASAAEASPARRAWMAVRWWIRGVTGEAKYDAYLAHQRAHHPDAEPLSERAFWRAEYARQEANPGSRCC